jgi:MFS family permease
MAARLTEKRVATGQSPMRRKLVAATSLWHFCLVLVLQAVFMGVNATIPNALVTDLVPKESLGRGLALFGATTWIGGMLGFAGAGHALQSLGIVPTFIAAISLVLTAILLLVPIRSAIRRHAVTRPSVE